MFCLLEKDEKTFKYLRMVIDHIRGNQSVGLTHLDNLLQKQEIMSHLYLNRLSEDDKEAMLKWIQKHGKGFRDYLNTIKVAALMWSWAEESKDLSWEDFCELTNRLNSTKACLDAIHS